MRAEARSVRPLARHTFSSSLEKVNRSGCPLTPVLNKLWDSHCHQIEVIR